MMDALIKKLDISHLPNSHLLVKLDDKLALADNLEPGMMSFDFSNNRYPIQMSMIFIILCVEGRAKVMINLNEQELNKGMVATMLAGNFFQITELSDDFKCAFLALSPQYVESALNAAIPMGLLQKLMTSSFFTLEEKVMRECVEVFRLMKDQLGREAFKFKDEVARHYMAVLICMAYQYLTDDVMAKKTMQPKSRKEELYLKFIQALEKDYTRQRSVIFYAEKLYVSPKYLSSVVHQVSGKYATEWIDGYVLLEAKTMLRMKDASIKDVSNHLNFPNQSFFAKYFKQRTGLTPRQYKNL